MIGIDIERIDRFKNLSKHLIERVYTKNELEYCNKFEDVYIHLAGIWCAKEAVIKALNFTKLTINQIEILHCQNGAPYVNLELIKDVLNMHHINHLHISISHTNENAIAVAMVEK